MIENCHNCKYLSYMPEIMILGTDRCSKSFNYCGHESKIGEQRPILDLNSVCAIFEISVERSLTDIERRL